MTPAEFKAIRRALGLSCQGMADRLGVASGRTVRRWEAGTREIPREVEHKMRLLSGGRLEVSDLGGEF